MRTYRKCTSKYRNVLVFYVHFLSLSIKEIRVDPAVPRPRLLSAVNLCVRDAGGFYLEVIVNKHWDWIYIKYYVVVAHLTLYL